MNSRSRLSPLNPKILALAVFLTLVTVASASPKKSIRFLLPISSDAAAYDREIANLIEEFNQLHPSVMVQAIRRGENFSSVRELMARHIAGDTPEIALIECSEFEAIRSVKIARPLPKSITIQGHIKGPNPETLPFQRTAPILVMNEDMFDIGSDGPEPKIRSWEDFMKWVDAASGPLATASGNYALGLPLQGPQGLWLFESLVQSPLWKREAGGLRSNRKLEAAIQVFQSLFDRIAVSKRDEGIEQAGESFLHQKIPLLVTALDALPAIKERASFKWRAFPMPPIPDIFLPTRSAHETLQSGSDLVILKDDPDVRAFVEYLYAPTNSVRWVVAGGFIPLNPSWTRTAEWKKLVSDFPQYAALVTELKIGKPRSTDFDVIRTHSNWIQAFHFLFGEQTGHLSTREVFDRLDSG